MKKIAILLIFTLLLSFLCSCEALLEQIIPGGSGSGGNQGGFEEPDDFEDPDDGENKEPTKKKYRYTVEFFIENTSCGKDLDFLLEGMILNGYEGDIVNIKEEISSKIPAELILDEESSSLSGEISEEGLKLTAYFKVDYSKLSFDFKQDNPYVKYAVSALGESEISGIVVNANASSGYALEATKGSAVGGVQLNVGARRVDDFDKIYLRAWVTNGQYYKIIVNGETEIGTLTLGGYRVNDLKALLTKAGVEEVNTIGFYSETAEKSEIYLDTLLFLNDENASTADPSFLMERDETHTYISDFNSPMVMGLTQKIGINHKGVSVPETCEISHGIAESVKGFYGYIYEGIILDVTGESSNVSGFKYNLPADFDLTQAKEITIRFSTVAWNGGYLASFFHFTNGDQVKNIINYCKIYMSNGQNATGNYTTTKEGTLDGQNYLRCTLVLDVAAFIRATRMTTIDGIIFGSNMLSEKYNTHIVDEIFFSHEATETDSTRIDFTTQTITDSQGYILSDTAQGIKLYEKSWAYAVCGLTEAISGADIGTVTVRYKEGGGDEALLKLVSGTNEIFVNLTKAVVGKKGVIDKTVDEYGFTIITLNFDEIPSDSWTIADRDTLSLTAISIGTSHSMATPIFDYVIINK